MRNLIEEAALRLHELHRTGASDPAADVFAAEPADVRVGSAIMPIVGRFAVRPPRPARRIDVDLNRLAMRGMLTRDAEHSPLASEYRILKRPLIRNALGQGGVPTPRGRLIMISSPEGREGRTFTAVNLAMSIAMEMDQRVLLVDADVASPSLSGLLDLPAGPGLMDLLADTGEQPSDALLQTQVEGLSILPIGEPNARATELIASGTMRALLDSLTMRDPDLLVIFDAPPLLTTTEARELASHMGQLVVVVQAGRTSQARLRQALSVAENVPERMLVLNGVSRRRAGWDSDVGGGWGRGTPTSEEAGA